MIAVVISALALVLSLYTFFSFDAKLKKQESILNDYKIKEYQEGAKDNKYAHLRIKTYWRDKDSLYLIIENEGPSDAYSIDIQNLDNESYLFRDIESSFPISTICAGDSEQLNLLVYDGMPEKTRIKVSWRDDSEEKHYDKVVLPIH